MRKKFIAGNWKMYKTISEAVELVESLKENLKEITKTTIAVCPPFICLSKVIEALSGTNIGVGAQNMYYEKEGAYTGEISGYMLKEIGCKYVIIGHSERRNIFNESDELINKKLINALELGLIPILCVGEKLEEREKGITEEIIKNQLMRAFKDIKDISKVVIAYEPVWAIGTGKNATGQQAQEVHAFIREWIKNHYSSEVAQNITIQYGGSVKPNNARELLSQPDIDGALVGGASLKADSFSEIVKIAEDLQ